MWGYVKSLVYADKPQTLDHLEDNIRRVIADMRPQMSEKVTENWTSGLDYIRANRGSHMSFCFDASRQKPGAAYHGRGEKRVVHPVQWLVTLAAVPLGLGSNLAEDMDVCRCTVPSRLEGSLNSRRGASPLVRLVEGKRR
ncbi:hypothetical protein TNCV_2744121 [Trichonephila clavipes]|nr:hypothetical protein TNCV_2744121 [Trichonephila clavipes]